MNVTAIFSATWLTVMAGCSRTPEFPPAAPDDAKGRDLFGTSKNDIWRYWGIPGTMQGPQPHHLRHFDGKSSVDVAIPAIFTEAACGAPDRIVAAEAGRLWLAAIYRWSCGQATEPSHSRIILGTLSRDGAWNDRSSFLPALSPPAVYTAVDLAGGFGVTVMRVEQRDAAGTMSVRYYRMHETEAVEILATTLIGGFEFLDADHMVRASGRSRTS